MATQTVAPWFFRQRFALFGALYGIAFFGGSLIAGAIGVPPVPAFAAGPHRALVAVFAVACAVGGYALRLWASSYISASIVWKQDVQGGELRVSGPYRFSRNPLYLGNIVQAIGIGLMGPWTVEVLLVPFVIAYSYVLIGVEEPFLARQNGGRYERYRGAVARLVPRPGKVAPDANQPASLAAGFRSELMTFGFAILVLVVVIARASSH